jgi:hypothetical protein
MLRARLAFYGVTILLLAASRFEKKLDRGLH